MAQRLRWLALGVALASLLGIFLQRAPSQSKSSAAATPADYLRWRREMKNWGRWGADDQSGTTNLITPAKILTAAKLVKSGIVISLAHAEPQEVAADHAGSGLPSHHQRISATTPRTTTR